MRPTAKVTPIIRLRGGLAIRCFTSASFLPTLRAAQCRRLSRYLNDSVQLQASRHQHNTLPPFLINCPLDSTYRNTFSTAARYNAISFRDLKSDEKSKETPRRDPKKSPEGPSKASSAEEEDPAEKAYREAQRESEESRKKSRQRQEQENESRDEQDENPRGSREQQSKRQEPPPPPPPHGNKSPWQVFTETLRSEFQASKEWNESTKQLASSAHQFTENESVKRARAAYTAASGAATSSTASAIKGTGKAIGQGAAWTWDSAVVKGVRTGVNATASGIDKVTKPVRDTKAYKTAVGGVKDVIDDGSSSKYGGWVEKEERRKQRELRELDEAGQSGRPGRRVEKMEEDPK